MNVSADTEPSPNPPPNGPAKIATDAKKDRFKIEYAGESIFQATVRLLRDGNELTLKAAAVRLFVVSKFEGWDVVTQSIRVAAVGSLSGDILSLCGHTAGRAPDVSVADQEGVAAGVYCEAQDWMLSVDPGPAVAWAYEELSAAAVAEGRAARVMLSASGSDIVLKFRPYYGARHCGAEPTPLGLPLPKGKGLQEIASRFD